MHLSRARTRRKKRDQRKRHDLGHKNEETAAFRERFKVPFTMIADPEKRLFRAFGLKQASVGWLFSANILVKGVHDMANGHLEATPKGYVRQLPGVFIIDPAGRIRFSRYSASPADHPRPETLLEVLRSQGRVLARGEAVAAARLGAP